MVNCKLYTLHNVTHKRVLNTMLLKSISTYMDSPTVTRALANYSPRASEFKIQPNRTVRQLTC